MSNGIATRIFMKRCGIGITALVGVLVPEAAAVGIVEAGAQGIEAEVGVVLFASIQVGVVARALVREEDAKGVVGVAVGDRAALVRKRTHAAAAVIHVMPRDEDRR